MNVIQLAGLLLMIFGAYVIIKAIAKAITAPKSGRTSRESRPQDKASPLFKRGICPKCGKSALRKKFTFLKCQSCWFIFPPSWLLALMIPLPLVGCALLLAKWLVQADNNIQNGTGSGLLQSLGFWMCLGLFAALCKITAYAEKLGKGIR
jgi:hypothetical protein